MAGKKATFHIPDRESHIVDILQAVSSGIGITPSEYTYKMLRGKFIDAGLLKEDGTLNEKSFKELLASLPPAVQASYKRANK